MASSWSTWAERLVGDHTSMQRCGIYGQEQGETWAVSDGMAATPEEVKFIVTNYDENDKFYTEGCRCEGKKYNFLKKVEDVLVFKKSKEEQAEGSDEKQDTPFLIAMNTQKGCLIGIANGDDGSKSKSICLMESIGKQLKDTGN
jgi:hypothetical protein